VTSLAAAEAIRGFRPAIIVSSETLHGTSWSTKRDIGFRRVWLNRIRHSLENLMAVIAGTLAVCCKAK
jgi:hypothetical protein